MGSKKGLKSYTEKDSGFLAEMSALSDSSKEDMIKTRNLSKFENLYREIVSNPETVITEEHLSDSFKSVRYKFKGVDKNGECRILEYRSD